MSARERFFKKVQQNNVNKPIHINTAEAEVRAFVSGWMILHSKLLFGLRVLVLKSCYPKSISPI